MAANLTDHLPLVPVGTISGNQEFMKEIPEKAGQTYLFGVPAQLNAGFVQEWDGATVAAGVVGVTKTIGANLAGNGTGAPGAFGSVAAPGAVATFGKVQGQTAAVNIAHGTPVSTGRATLALATEDTIFEAQIDHNAAGAYASVQSQLGSVFGMTKDATGHWYIDLAKVTKGTNTVVTIVGFDPIDAIGTNGARLYFAFQQAAIQLVQ